MNDSTPKFRKNCKIIHISDENLSSSSSQVNSQREKMIYNNNNYFLYSWGKNKYGELGLGTQIDSNIPSPITSLESQSIYSIKAGGRNAIIISSDGSVYLCGSNIFGLLAENSNILNNERNQKTFKKIKYFKENNLIIKEVSIAEFHCLALDENGKIFGWGGNLFNKLGKKFDILQGIPNQIIIKNKIISISCGDYHSCALSDEGILYSWGGGGESYNKGQCGHGTTKDILKPKKVEFFIKNNIKITKVCCGGYHTIVITDSNELFSFGKGIYGQCGYGQHENISTPKKVYFNEKQNIQYENNKEIIIIDVKCGGEHSLFLSSNHKLYTCGHGYLGQLGLGNNKNFDSPIIVKSLTNKKIIEISAGWSHSLVLTNEGNIYATGCNKYGELGIGKDLNRYKYTWIECLSKLNISHISAGGHHSWCVIDSNNPLKNENNEPEPLLKSNFSMIRKNKRKFSEISKNSNNSNSSFSQNNRSNIHNKSAISEDINRRRNNSSDKEDFDLDKIGKNSYKKIKKLFDDYNNNEKDTSIDYLIENINKIDNYQNEESQYNDEDEDKKKFFFNSKEDNDINNLNYINNFDSNKGDVFDDSFKDILTNDENQNTINNHNNNKKYINNGDNFNNNIIYKKNIINNQKKNKDEYNNNIYKNEEIEENENKSPINNNVNKFNNVLNNINYFCELKILYTDLNLSHRFIRFQTSTEYNKLNNIIKNNYINKNKGIISFQFQRDDEIEKNNLITPEINYIFNKMKNEKLIDLDKLSYSYTLGIVYDYNKNDEEQQYKQKKEINKVKSININNCNKNNKGPFFGFKVINSEQIISSENEKYLSNWIIDFNKMYNELINTKDNITILDSPTFFELRPNIFK